MQKTILNLKRNSKSKKDFLIKAYSFVTRKYSGGKHQTYKHFNRLFWSLEKTWNHAGFIQCTQQNHVLRIFLVKSGFFKDEDIELRHMFYLFSIHQYLMVKVNSEKIVVDPWSAFLKVKLGRRVSAFGEF